MKVYLKENPEFMFDAFNTRGGHVIICVLLLMVGATFIKIGIPEGRDILVFSLGVMARSMNATASLPEQSYTLVPPAEPKP
jgi:hypothetical protein